MKSKEKICNKILNHFQLDNLRRHVYSSSGSTLLDPYMQVYWKWLVEFIPVWIAPNMITLVGLLINVGTSLILMWYSPTGHANAPSEAYLACGVGLFIYQSLDAIDGKHARRTGTANPLGELFDHGCDAISTVFVIIAYGIATDLGPSLWFFYVCCCCNFFFYAAHWQTLVSGKLHFGKVDVTEAQMFLIGIQLWTAFFGPGLWNVEVIPGLPLKYALLCCSTLSTSLSFIMSGNANTILTGGTGKNGATIADTSVLSPCIPILVISVMFYKILVESTCHVFQNNTVMFVLTMGFTFTKITNSLVVAHMTKSPPTLVLDSIMLGPAILLINQYLSAPVPETFLLFLAMCFTAYDSIRYCVDICGEICDDLEIPCLTMPEGVKIQKELPPSNKQRAPKLRQSSDRPIRTVRSTGDMKNSSRITRSRSSVIRREHSSHSYSS